MVVFWAAASPNGVFFETEGETVAVGAGDGNVGEVEAA